MKNKIKKVKIWWKIPSLDSIDRDEAYDLIYKTMSAAADTFLLYYNVREDPSFFKSFWFYSESDKAIPICNYMIGKVNDPRVQYFAEIKKH